MLTVKIDKGVRPSGLLDDIRAFLKRYLVLRDCHYDITAVWVLHTFCIDAFSFTLYLAITSATPSAGKTRMLEVLDLLIDDGSHNKAWLTASTRRPCWSERLTPFNPYFSSMERMGRLRVIRNTPRRCGSS